MTDRNEASSATTMTPQVSDSAPQNPAASDPLDASVVRLAAQAAFLQAFAEGLAEGIEERPVEEVLSERARGETAFS